MPQTRRPTSTARLCFIGSNSLFSFVALETLLSSQIHVSQIILTGHAPATHTDPRFPIATEATSIQAIARIRQLAITNQIPVIFLGLAKDHHQQWRQICEKRRPDFVFVACFPEKLPTVLIQWPHIAAINLHPSLLPTYRGPDPIFWQLRHNELHTGVTLHQLAANFDAGPIVCRHEITPSNDASPSELTRLFAQQGVKLFIELLGMGSIEMTEQDAAHSSYYPFPSTDDFVIDPDWTVEHAYRFINGTTTPDSGYPVTLNQQTIFLHSALGFAKQPELPNYSQDDVVTIPFADGVLYAKTV